MTRRWSAAVLAMSLTVAVGVTGCGSDTSDLADTGDADASNPSTTAASTTTSAPAGSGSVAIALEDYRFVGLPDSIEVGSTFAVHNDSTTEVHEFVASRLPDDETRSIDEIAALPDAELEALFAGVPAVVVVAAPGEDAQVVLGSTTIDEPGRYAVFCAIQIGADPDEYFAAAATASGPVMLPDAGPPHYTADMFGEFTAG